MTGQLLLITIGPVQDFIAQARRTRDLWYGSHLLSELSRNVARSLAIGGAKLIFPALDPALDKDAAELLPCLAPVRQNGAPPLSIANKIMAEVPVGLDAVTLAESARDELQRSGRSRTAKTAAVHHVHFPPE